MTVLNSRASLVIVALSLVLLPFVLDFVGLPLRSAIDVVAFAIACMGLNILVGNTGLVSFGHGAWFGLGAYAAALSQRYWFPGSVFLPALFAIVFVAVSAGLSGALILRRRGVYFSLLTLALTALLFAICYRWTEFTGGESGLGGVTRAAVLGVDLERDGNYYWVVVAVAMGVCFLLWRFHRSPVGSVLVAIRENEQRARFVGYPTNWYKLIGFVLSAAIVAVAGTLSVFNHRFASAEPLSVAFSGELIAMVVIGGMRSFLGPALGALFFILFASFYRYGLRTGFSILAFCSLALLSSPQQALSASGNGCWRRSAGGRSRTQRWRVEKRRTFCHCREAFCASMKMTAWPFRQKIWRRVSAASMPCAASTSRCATRRCTP